MKTDIINVLDGKRSELKQFVEQNISTIVKDVESEPQKVPKPANTNLINNIFQWIVKIFTKPKENIQKQEEVLSQSESIELYNTIKSTIETMDDNWNLFLSENKNTLKEIIDATNWNSDDKTNYTLKAMIASPISYQMSDILTKIIKYGKEPDEKELNNYIMNLKAELAQAIDKAYKEQYSIYKEILDRLD